MVNYTCAFSQSESGKYFEWIIILYILIHYALSFWFPIIMLSRNSCLVPFPSISSFQVRKGVKIWRALHLIYGLNVMAELSSPTREICNSLSLSTHAEVSDDWLPSTGKRKQPANDFVMSRCSSNTTLSLIKWRKPRWRLSVSFATRI